MTRTDKRTAARDVEDSPEFAVYLALLASARGIDHVHHSGLLVKRSGVQLERALHPVLATIGQRGPLRTTDLAAALALRTPTVSRHVQRLEALGLVERVGVDDDRRASELRLSPEGRKAFTAVRAAWLAIVGDVLKSLDGDPEVFAKRFLRFGELLESAS